MDAVKQAHINPEDKKDWRFTATVDEAAWSHQMLMTDISIDLNRVAGYQTTVLAFLVSFNTAVLFIYFQPRRVIGNEMPDDVVQCPWRKLHGSNQRRTLTQEKPNQVDLMYLTKLRL